ncbi:MAG: exodeoxyribonuclease VII large subunit [Deltaproteobacteria bacterium]|nr:exodeoxyribonuclease VII large subunit [Deltaproteobacteria bacterium]
MADELFNLSGQPLTISQINSRARVLLERNFSSVLVVGEISGHKVVSGHHYFSLKDKDSQLNAVLFRKEASTQKLTIVDGIEIIARGRLTIYGPYGRYQLVIDELQSKGEGALQAAFAELKARLFAEGLFAAEHKRPLPLLPKNVAVVTSATGAVIRDIVQVAERRWPNARILVIPTRVQGSEAAVLVTAAIYKASELAKQYNLEVMIVARGGGSLEDLWCFNDERVARAIYESSIPVVSAIGHETDFTIADFVADLRAPTPSAAAELVFPNRHELLLQLRQQLFRSHTAFARIFEQKRMYLRALRAELGDARRLLSQPQQQLSQAYMTQSDAIKRMLLDKRLTLQQLETRLVGLHPRMHLVNVRSRLSDQYNRMRYATYQYILSRKQRLDSFSVQLRALSPLGVLDRGYAIIQNASGKLVQSYEQVQEGEAIKVSLAKGGISATVNKIFSSN